MSLPDEAWPFGEPTLGKPRITLSDAAIRAVETGESIDCAEYRVIERLTAGATVWGDGDFWAMLADACYKAGGDYLTLAEALSESLGLTRKEPAKPPSESSR